MELDDRRRKKDGFHRNVATSGSMIVGAIALSGALLQIFQGQTINSALFLCAAALAFGLLANAVNRS